MNWLKIIVFTLSGLLVVCLLAIVIVTTTNIGLRCLFYTVEYIVPTLKTEKITGSLVKGFTINGLSFKSQVFDMDIKSLSAQLWLNRKTVLVVSKILAEEPRIRIKSEEETDQAASQANVSSQQIEFPLAIELENVRLNDGLLDLYGTEISWQQLKTAISMQDHNLHIKTSVIDAMALNIQPAQSVADPGTTTQPDNLQLVLESINLPLNFQVDRIEVNHFTYNDGRNKQILDTIALSGTTQNSQIGLSVLEITSTEADISIMGNIELQGDYPLSVELQGRSKVQPFDHQAVFVKANGSLKDLVIDSQMNGQIKAELTALLHLTDVDMPFNITLKSPELMWPLANKPNYRMSRNNLAISGSLAQYQLDFSSQASGADIPNADITIKARGNLEYIDVETLQLATLSGFVDAKGRIEWSRLMRVNAALSIKDINPGKKWPNLTGVLNGDVVFDAVQQANHGWNIDVTPLLLKGNLNKQTVLMNGKLGITDLGLNLEPVLQVQDLTLSHGENRIRVSGVLDKVWHMKAIVNVPEIEKSVPDMLGKINGAIEITGSIRQPDIHIKLNASGINYNDMTTEDILLSGNFSLTSNNQSDLQLKIKNTNIQSLTFSDITASFIGSLNKHDVKVLIDGDPVSWSVNMIGSLDSQNRWQGKMTNSDGSVGENRFLLQEPVNITYAGGETDISPHCWLQGTGSICLLDKTILGQEGQFRLKVSHLNMGELLIPFLPENGTLITILNADIHAGWEKGRALSLTSNVNFTPGEYRQTVNTQAFTFGWSQCALTVNSHDKVINSQLDINLVNNGSVHSQFTLNNTENNQAITGNITVKNIQLDQLEPVLPLYDHFNGMLGSQISIKGTLDAPIVLGNISVSDVMATGEDAPLIIEQGNLNIRFDKNKAIIAGGIVNEGTPLSIRGSADWQKKNDWLLDMSLKGDKLKVQMEPMLALRINPDLHLTLSPHLAEVKGSLAIPWARFSIQRLPESAVRVSKDVVIVNSDMQPVDNKEIIPFDIKTDVLVDIGPDVKIDAFGLKANLLGKVHIRFKDDQPVVFGELVINDGAYRMFGQSLVIQHGRLLFNGPPGQPYLNIEAIRDPKTIQDDVIAGIRVTGPADAPKITVFSDPSMPQQNALSYLLTGKSIDQDVDGSSAMTIMAISMGLSKSNQTVGYIGEQLGIKELALNAEGAGDESKVTISGYITPDLQIKYGVGIYQALAEFTARYRLIKNLFVEAVSSDENNSVDLLYQFSF